MSNKNTSQTSSVNNTPFDDQEVLEGEIIDDTAPAKTGPVTAFVQKHRVWFIAGAAVAAGFVLHGFLGRPDTCDVDYDEDYEELTDTEDPESE